MSNINRLVFKQSLNLLLKFRGYYKLIIGMLPKLCRHTHSLILFFTLIGLKRDYVFKFPRINLN